MRRYHAMACAHACEHICVHLCGSVLRDCLPLGGKLWLVRSEVIPFANAVSDFGSWPCGAAWGWLLESILQVTVAVHCACLISN